MNDYFRVTSLACLGLLLALAPLSAKGQGILMPTEPGIGALSIGHERIKISVVDGTAVTHVDQTFVNHTNRQLEATFLFPLPKGAALQDFALWIGGKKQKGEVLEKDKARNIYEGIVRQMKDPGLLEYVDHDLFRARVFPVPAKGEQRIEISFSQVLDFHDGVYSYRYPLGAARLQNARGMSTLKDFTVTASLRSRVPLKSVYSPSHSLETKRPDEHRAELGFEKVRERLDRDLLLYYTVGTGDVGINLLTYAPKLDAEEVVPGQNNRPKGDPDESEDEPGYFLMMVSPKQDWQSEEILGKTVTFVVDTSGSMAGKKVKAAKKALKYCLERLLPADRFNIVRFSTSVERFRNAPIEANQKNLSAARRFLNTFNASGGTAIHEALMTALRDRPEGGEAHMIVFLTDGEPTVGLTEEEGIASSVKQENKGGSRIFSFGVGTELNATLLDRLSSESRASVEYASDGTETELKVSGFYDRIAFPVLTDVKIDLGEAQSFDVFPRERPALFKGEQVIVVGRYRSPGKHQVKLRGKTGEKDRSYVEKVNFPRVESQHDFIAKLWAVRKVGYLLEEIRAHGEQKELKDEVVELGKRFGIVTPYTSYLVLEDVRPRGGPTPQPEPENRLMGGTRPALPAFLPKEAPDRGTFPDAPSMSDDEAPASGLGRRSRERSKALSGGGFTSHSGEGAVAASTALKDMKEKTTSDTDEASLSQRYFAGRAFTKRADTWTDSRWDPKAKRLEIASLSSAYFELLRMHPELRALLSLGGKFRVMVDASHGIIIGDTGKSEPKELTAFLKRP